MKRGFGLMEVMAAAVVLGFLIVGLMQLQKGNREAVIRIRARDGAQIVAQQYIDSLSKLGVSSIVSNDASGYIIDERTYEWKGSPNIDVPIKYGIKAKIDDDTGDDFKSVEKSKFNPGNKHTMAKKIDLEVSWDFKKIQQSIKVTRVIK